MERSRQTLRNQGFHEEGIRTSHGNVDANCARKEIDKTIAAARQLRAPIHTLQFCERRQIRPYTKSMRSLVRQS